METPGTLNPEESLSFVIPLRDEAPTLGQLFKKIEQQVSKVTSRWEVIFADYGNNGGSCEVISPLAEMRTRGKGAVNKLKKAPFLKLLTLSYRRIPCAKSGFIRFPRRVVSGEVIPGARKTRQVRW